MGTHVREGASFARTFEMIETTRLRRQMEDAVEALIAALDALDAPQEDLEDSGDDEPSLASFGGQTFAGHDADLESDIGDEPEGDDADTEEGCEDEGAGDFDEPFLGWTEDINQTLAMVDAGSDEDDIVAPENAGDQTRLPLEGLGPRAARLALRTAFDLRLGLRSKRIDYLRPRPLARFPHEPADKPRLSFYAIEQEMEMFIQRARKRRGKTKRRRI